MIYNNQNQMGQMNQRNKMEENNQSQAELLISLVYGYINRRGWLLITKDMKLIGNFNSLELFKILSDQINSNNINSLVVTTIDKKYMFSGQNMFIILYQIIPLFLKNNKNEMSQIQNIQNDNLGNNNGNNMNINRNNNFGNNPNLGTNNFLPNNNNIRSNNNMNSYNLGSNYNPNKINNNNFMDNSNPNLNNKNIFNNNSNNNNPLMGNKLAMTYFSLMNPILIIK